MEKTIKDQLLLLESEFRNSDWQTQLNFIEFLNSNDVESDSITGIEQKMELFVEVVVTINEYYLKTSFENVKKLLDETIRENVLVKGILYNLLDRWWMREYSSIMNDYSKEEAFFLMDEIISNVYIKRVHKSSKIITKRMADKFKKEFYSKSVLKCMKLIEALIEKFLKSNLTYNSFINFLKRETLFSSELMNEFIKKVAFYQNELERVYVFNKINQYIVDK